MNTGLIFDIERFSIHDGPGIRTTIFFKGCPLSCAWCHNPESQSEKPEIMLREQRCIRCGACLQVCPTGAIFQSGDSILTNLDRCDSCGECVRVCQAEARELVGRTMTVAQVMSQIEKDVVFYDQSGGGVTFSGGEPLMQCGFLRALLRECKERGIHTAVDTSGLANGKALEQIGECVDLFLYDLKIMNAEKHRQFTGVSNALILDNLRALAQSGRQIRIRAPIIPGINDDEGNISELGQFVASLARRPPVSLLPYHKAGVHKYARLQKAYALPEAPTPQEEQMNTIAKALTSHGLEVRVGG